MQDIRSIIVPGSEAVVYRTRKAFHESRVIDNVLPKADETIHLQDLLAGGLLEGQIGSEYRFHLDKPLSRGGGMEF